MTGALPRAIVIRPDPFGNRWDVEILPPLAEGPCFDQDFSCIKRARGYASGLRMSLGYKITDLSGPADGGR